MTEVQILKPQSKVKDLLTRVYELLCTKSRADKVPQNVDNKTRLGKTNFWFATAPDRQSYLIYDSNPEIWTKDDVQDILNDIEGLEWKYIYKNSTF